MALQIVIRMYCTVHSKGSDLMQSNQVVYNSSIQQQSSKWNTAVDATYTLPVSDPVVCEGIRSILYVRIAVHVNAQVRFVSFVR